MTSDGGAKDDSDAGGAGSRVERFSFTKASVGMWQDPEGRHRNWPVVYTLNNKAEVYIGESLNAVSRMRQHLESSEKKGLDAVRIVIDDTYNKSVCLDLESFLIRMFSGDGRYQVLNRNDGVTNADYYDRGRYQETFKGIFDASALIKVVDRCDCARPATPCTAAVRNRLRETVLLLDLPSTPQLSLITCTQNGDGPMVGQ